MNATVLLIEDDPNIQEFLAVALARENYQLVIANSGMEALMQLQEATIDLVLLDLGLPDIDGLELLAILRKRSDLPIVIVSARSDETEKVKALDLGADDYMTKPFGTMELLARMRTALRHQGQESSQGVIENGELTMDLDRQLVYKNGNEVHLTKTEYRILALLFQQIGKVVTYQKLMATIWGPYSDESQALRVNMSNLRKKLETDTLQPEYLITEIGVGYRLRDHR
ncbi:MAG: response regulator transcription factor [Aerococcus sp.]|nr:response regulator transcription factor [Aerococcus sp.]